MEPKQAKAGEPGSTFVVDLEWNRKSIFEKLDWLKHALDELVAKANHNISVQQEQLRAIAARLAALEKPGQSTAAVTRRPRKPRHMSSRQRQTEIKKETLKMPRKPTFGALIRNARVKRKLSVAEVAAQVGVSQAAIYLWETDRSRPRDANLDALRKVLRLPVRVMREMAG